MRNYIAVFANSGPLKLLEKRKVVPRRKIKK
jgi:hypothetical protein